MSMLWLDLYHTSNVTEEKMIVNKIILRTGNLHNFNRPNTEMIQVNIDPDSEIICVLVKLEALV